MYNISFQRDVCQYTQIIHIHVPSFQVASGDNNALLGGGVRVRVGIENKGRTKGD